MNTYEAFLAAADHIERFPALYDFTRTLVPQDKLQTGCVLGWVKHFRGELCGESVFGTQYPNYLYEVLTIPGLPDSFAEFCMQMDDLPRTEQHNTRYWRVSSFEAVRKMRLYAYKHLQREDHKIVSWKDCVWRPVRAVGAALAGVLLLIGMR